MRTKECRGDNSSPLDKSNNSNEDMYPIPCRTTINPISVQTVLPIPTINYDISFHHNTTYATTPSFAQPLYGTQTATFPVQEIYPGNHQNLVLANGGQYFPHQEYSAVNNPTIDSIKRPNWEDVSTTSFVTFFKDLYYTYLDLRKIP